MGKKLVENFEIQVCIELHSLYTVFKPFNDNFFWKIANRPTLFFFTAVIEAQQGSRHLIQKHNMPICLIKQPYDKGFKIDKQNSK